MIAEGEDLQTCPLCCALQNELFFKDSRREYYRCDCCFLVFVPKKYHLAPAAEKAEYDLHQNSSADLAYRQFLNRTLSPLQKHLDVGANGLDFGCGSGPTVSQIMAEQGYEVADYDPLYYPDKSLLRHSYDFITLTEVIEHLVDPLQVLHKLQRCLKPGAIMAIMTKRVIDQKRFARWHYTKDPTHIGFYSEATFNWIAEYFDWQLEVIEQDVVFFHKISNQSVD